MCRVQIRRRCRSGSVCGAGLSLEYLAEDEVPPTFLRQEKRRRPGPTILTSPPRESRRLLQGRTPYSSLRSRRDAGILQDSLHQRYRRAATSAVRAILLGALRI